MIKEWIQGKDLEKYQIDTENQEPVDIQDIKDVISLVNTASKVNCTFVLHLILNIGEFNVKSDNFKNIDLLKANKTQDERLSITHTDALMLIDTTINVKDIIGIEFTLKFINKEEVMQDV